MEFASVDTVAVKLFLCWRNASVSITAINCSICQWLFSASASPCTDHLSNTTMVLINLLQLNVVPSPLCSLWAAGWWVSVHSPFSQGREVGRGCLCTLGQPSSLCPGSVCWGCVPSVCSVSTVSQTVERGPWRALGPDPFPEGKKQTQTKQLHINGFHNDTVCRSCSYVPSAKNWPFSWPSHQCLPFWHSQPARWNKTRYMQSEILCGKEKH